MKWLDDDPLLYSFLALYIAIVWYVEITPEQAFRIVDGSSNMKKMALEITPNVEEKIKKVCSSPCSKVTKRKKSMDRLCKKFGVSKYEVKKILGGKPDV